MGSVARHAPGARPRPLKAPKRQHGHPRARRTARREAGAAAGAAHGAGVGGGVRDPVFPLETIDPFPSRLAPPRRIDVMLPPSYRRGGDRRYPVLWMHDGQNAVDPSTSFRGVDWGLDEAAAALWRAGAAREFIAVLVWNTPDRAREYMPAEPLRWLASREQCWYERVHESHYNPTSDAYADMLALEAKPWLDAAYQTLPGAAHHAQLGSSMGALAALYALQRHPEVFGAAACLSTHWPPGGGVAAAWLADGGAPDPATHRLYFDRGDRGLDGEYGPYQRQADATLRAAGYREGVSFQSLAFPGEDHDEAAWRRRLHHPLRFLFGAGGAEPGKRLGEAGG